MHPEQRAFRKIEVTGVLRTDLQARSIAEAESQQVTVREGALSSLSRSRGCRSATLAADCFGCHKLDMTGRLSPRLQPERFARRSGSQVSRIDGHKADLPISKPHTRPRCLRWFESQRNSDCSAVAATASAWASMTSMTAADKVSMVVACRNSLTGISSASSSFRRLEFKLERGQAVETDLAQRGSTGTFLRIGLEHLGNRALEVTLRSAPAIPSVASSPHRF